MLVMIVMTTLPVVFNGKTVLRFKYMFVVFPSKSVVTDGPVVVKYGGWNTAKSQQPFYHFADSTVDPVKYLQKVNDTVALASFAKVTNNSYSKLSGLYVDRSYRYCFVCKSRKRKTKHTLCDIISMVKLHQTR